MTNTIQLGLHPDGNLQMGLPAADGGIRWVLLREPQALDTIYRTLHALARNETGIGSDGAPTGAQVRHWQMHATFPSPKCAFCQHEARQRLRDLAQFVADDGTVPVTKVTKGRGGKPKPLASNQTAEELGL